MAAQLAVRSVGRRLMLVLLMVPCLGHESRGEEKDRAFLLEIAVSSSASVHSQEIVCDLPHKWRTETTIGKNTKTVHSCDGDTAWSYSMIDDGVEAKRTNITRCNIKELLKTGAERDVYASLFVEGMDGIACPVNPFHPRWKKAFLAEMITAHMKSMGEDKFADTKVELFETTSEGEPRFVMWFGKEDGILRKQVLYRKDEKGKSTKEWITWTVEKIDRDKHISDTRFALELGKGETAKDITKEAAEQLKQERENKKERNGEKK